MKKLGVKVASKEEIFTIDTTGRSNDKMRWEANTLEFTAEGAETTLELFSALNDDVNCGPALDNVSVAESR